ELIAQLCRFLLQVLQLAFAEALVILGGSDIMIRHAVLQHVIHGLGHFMAGHVRDRLRADEAAWDAAVNKPIRQGVQISGVGAKGAHALLIVAIRHTGHDVMRANVYPSRMGVELAHAVKWTSFTRGRWATMTLTEVAHGGLLAGAITLDHFSRIAYSSG